VGRGGLEPPTSALACLKRLCIVIPELADGNGCAKDYSGVIEATPPIPSGKRCPAQYLRYTASGVKWVVRCSKGVSWPRAWCGRAVL
jgi:hypothetical protein